MTLTTYEEIGSCLRLEFDMPDVDIARGLKKIGATATDVGKLLSGFGSTAVSSVLQAVDYGVGEINDAMGFISCPIDGWVCPDCCVKLCCVKW